MLEHKPSNHFPTLQLFILYLVICKERHLKRDKLNASLSISKKSLIFWDFLKKVSLGLERLLSKMSINHETLLEYVQKSCYLRNIFKSWDFLKKVSISRDFFQKSLNILRWDDSRYMKIISLPWDIFKTDDRRDILFRGTTVALMGLCSRTIVAPASYCYIVLVRQSSSSYLVVIVESRWAIV